MMYYKSLKCPAGWCFSEA